MRNGAGKTVEQEAFIAVRLGDAGLDQIDDNVIRDQPAGIHDFLCHDSQLGASLDRRTQHIAGGNLWNAEPFLDVTGLCALSRPWAA